MSFNQLKNTPKIIQKSAAPDVRKFAPLPEQSINLEMNETWVNFLNQTVKEKLSGLKSYEFQQIDPKLANIIRKNDSFKIANLGKQYYKGDYL